jgi:saccharopine dehydrogenase-like NADP-dependent oxidoreductase
MKVIVLGSGKIGSIMAKDFAGSVEGAQLTLSDISEERARAAASSIEGAEWTLIDTSDQAKLTETLSGFDLVLGALPGDFGWVALKASVGAGVDMLDVAFTPEDPMELDGAAKEAGVTVIPDCGVAPGLSNILVGYSAARLDRVDEAQIMVGGIPEELVPPLNYTITWSAEGLIDEYVREVSIIQDGKTVQVPALSGLEEIEFPGVGTLEAFYTDGLRSLAKTFPEVKNMYEKTLRYPGHVEKVKLLRELGYFSDEPLTVGGSEVSPRLVTARLLERSLWKPEIGDLLAMRIQIMGEKKGKKTGYRHQVLDRYDHETDVSAMARTTAYTASIVAGMLAKGAIDVKGVIPPEKLGMDTKFTETLISELKSRGVIVEETVL